MGYTPVFNSVFDGTLAGKWPDSAVWLTLLALCDKHGHVNLSHAAISGRTGWPTDLLKQGIDALMEPDASSQTPDEGGRRLVLIDPSRPWGWRIVNHGKYREKARLNAKDSQRTESGEDAARKRDARVPRGPPKSPSTNNKQQTHSKNPPKPPLGLDSEAWERFVEYRVGLRKPIREVSVEAAQKKLAGFGERQAAVVEQTVANGWTGIFELTENRDGRRSGPPRKNRAEQAWDDFEAEHLNGGRVDCDPAGLA